jgi:hypothetical protein
LAFLPRKIWQPSCEAVSRVTLLEAVERLGDQMRLLKIAQLVAQPVFVKIITVLLQAKKSRPKMLATFVIF